jgi:phosphoenolpyruvate carboxykinase (GTP)
MSDLANCDPAFNDPKGIPLAGIVYGGRDSDTCVPVEQAFDWTHGVVCKGASLESETTAATLGQEGVRRFDLMSILDFLSLPLGEYIDMHLNFIDGIKKPPVIFSVNYFLRGTDGSYLNSMADKRVWLQWAELRVNGDADVLTGPTGYIPRYEDLSRLFKEYLSQDFTERQYEEQFSVRVREHLQKIERIAAIYRSETAAVPDAVFSTLDAQKARLEEARSKHGDRVSPFDL